MKIKAYFMGFSSRQDGSYGIRFATQELNADEIKQLHEMLNSFGELEFTVEAEDEH